MTHTPSRIGGELRDYTKLLAESREQALDRMAEQAIGLGADAVIMVRFQTSMVMSSASEMLAYQAANGIEVRVLRIVHRSGGDVGIAETELRLPEDRVCRHTARAPGCSWLSLVIYGSGSSSSPSDSWLLLAGPARVVTAVGRRRYSRMYESARGRGSR